MASPKKAFITGVTGQDGSYLADLLLEKGYEVHALIRRSSTINTQRIEHLLPEGKPVERFNLHFGDLADANNLTKILEKIVPDEVYNLAAQSHVRISFDMPVYTADVVGIGALRLLEVIRNTGLKPRYYQASSSEMFGASPPPQNEQTPFYPRSPYGMSKVFAFWATKNYREAYNIHASNGILFNHESPRRGENFVTRKITIAFAEMLAGKRDKLSLGNLDASRDWGYAPEYVEAMWLMLQQDKPDDYVIATGETHTVREFLEEVGRASGILDWEKRVTIDQNLFRPAEVDSLQGDASKAHAKLGWKAKTTCKELARIMLDADCQKLGVKLSTNK